MESCVFCSIVKGELDCARIYENMSVIAIMDISPITVGHALVMPKKHGASLDELDDLTVGEMLKAGKKIGMAMKKSSLGCSGVNYLLSDGKDAGQEVFHAHLHVLPRYKNDGFGFRVPSKERRKTGMEELEKVAAKIRAGML